MIKVTSMDASRVLSIIWYCFENFVLAFVNILLWLEKSHPNEARLQQADIQKLRFGHRYRRARTDSFCS